MERGEGRPTTPPPREGRRFFQREKWTRCSLSENIIVSAAAKMQGKRKRRRMQ
jgi:hypothetical protein